MERRITLISIPRPQREINMELQWLGNALGLFNMRDKDKTCFRIFITLYRGTKSGHPFSSDELADHLAMSRGTVMHHVNKLMKSGIVIRNGARYVLRVEDLTTLVDEIKRDVDRMFVQMMDVAEDIEKQIR